MDNRKLLFTFFQFSFITVQESIARSSILYPAISQSKFMRDFFEFNKHDKTCLYSNRMIYSPKVLILKVSRSHKAAKEEDEEETGER
jgi:uncharacterized protein (TIGR02452 family)